MRKLSFFLLAICLLFDLTFLNALTQADIPIIANPQNRTDKRKSKVALCAIFQNDAPYLKEWIDFHRVIGVSHFYLYDNLSQDNPWEVLKPYVEQGIVELFSVPFDSSVYQDGAKTHNFVQVCSYNHALDLARHKNQWLAIIDTDEFICPVKDNDLPTLLSRYKYAGALIVFWQIYGTSNIWELKPGELLIEKLLYKAPSTGVNAQFKSIVRPRYATCLDPHYCTLKEDMFAVTSHHRRFSHQTDYGDLPIDVIRINHYTYRTDSYYHLVKKARRRSWGDNPSPAEEAVRLETANSVYDPVMLRFTPLVRKQMNEKVKADKPKPPQKKKTKKKH